MGKKDVGRALDLMGDPDVRAQLAEGNFSVVEGDLKLTDKERQLVQAAAADYPDLTKLGDFGKAARYALGPQALARLAFT